MCAIVIYSFYEYNVKFNKLTDRLRKAKLKLSSKCEFLRKEIIYLRYLINENGPKLDSKKKR